MPDYELSLDIQEQLLPVTLGLQDNTLAMSLDFGGGGFVPYYDGAYIVTPTAEGFILATKEKRMRDDLTVNAVPYAEASNPSGGLTVSILS